MGRGRPGVGQPSNATTPPGSASATNSVRRSAPPKQQLVHRPLPSIGQKSAIDAVGLDDPDAVLDRGRDVEAAVGVEAEAVTAAAAERLDHPLAAAVGVHALQALALDDHDGAVGLEGDAVAEEEAVGERADRSVALVDHHASGPVVVGWRQWPGSVK